MTAPEVQSGARRWVLAAVVAGAMYFAIGRAFATAATSTRLARVWAWLISLVVFVVHLWYERRRMQSSRRAASLHVALAVAIGAAGLALVAMLRSSHTGPIKPIWFASLILWPAITAIPAFVSAFIALWLLDRATRTPSA